MANKTRFNLTFPSRSLTCAVRRELVQARAKTKKNLFFIGLCRAQPNLRRQSKVSANECRDKRKDVSFSFWLCRMRPNLRRKAKVSARRAEWQENVFLLTFPSLSGLHQPQGDNKKTGIIYAILPHFPIPKSLPFSQSPNHASVKC